MQQQQFESENEGARISPLRRDARAKHQVVGAESEAEGVDASRSSASAGTLESFAAHVNANAVSASQEALEPLLAVIKQEAAKRKHNTRVIKIFFQVLSGILVLLCLHLWISSGRFPWQIIQGLGGLVGMVGIAAGYSKTQKAATRQIAEFEDVRAAGPMIEMLSAGDVEVTRTIIPALTRVLPRLQASDAQLINAEQRAVLNMVLQTQYSGMPVNIPDFYSAALKALQQVGDEKSLPIVEMLSRGDGMAAYYPGLKVQAAETLPFLRQRVEQTRANQTLLRASAAEEAGPDTLLRAAMPTASADDPAQLLRADIKDQSNQGKG